MQSYTYRLFGMTLKSEFSFPELASVATRKMVPGKTISIGPRDFPLPHFSKDGWRSFYGLDYWFSPQQPFAVIRSLSAGSYRIHFREKRIDWMPDQGTSTELARHVLAGRVMGLLLCHQLPSFLLHAGVVVREGQGICFCGVISQGKSTLTACFLNGGFSLLSDDIAVIQRKKGRFLL